MTDHQDKLVELIRRHAFFRDPSAAVFRCTCGDRYATEALFEFDGAHAQYAEHLAKVFRGYLRERPIVATAPTHGLGCDCRGCMDTSRKVEHHQSRRSWTRRFFGGLR